MARPKINLPVWQRAWWGAPGPGGCVLPWSGGRPEGLPAAARWGLRPACWPGGDVFAVFNGFVEGLGELFGNENGEIRISAFLMGIGMTVHRHEAVVVFRHHKAVGVHAERAHPVVKGFGEINKL